jgi:2-amino-4-hydroxy-6-hydroxymethyldihydropteridine diphosphokinase
MSNPAIKYVLLTGSDLGDRLKNLRIASDKIQLRTGNIIGSSEIHESEPWGFKSKTKFLNQALLVESNLDPEEVLNSILSIESEMGRQRIKEQWTSRIIDIDIICAEELTFHSAQLTIPHKRLHEREFVLIPLCEIVGEWNHPIYKRTYHELFSALSEIQANELI